MRGEGGTGLDTPRIAAVLLLFVACLAVLLYFGRPQWFFMDEWELLANRSALDPNDLLRPHNGHWITVPLLVYRAIWPLAGLHAYWPYQLVLVLAHLLLALQLAVLIRRLGTGFWLTTCLVLPFCLFGSGVHNILWAFQLTFVGALVAGLGHMLLADHGGPAWTRRDWLGLCSGALGLMCSGLAPAMVVGVGVSVWVRRGLRPALLHTLPLAVLYLSWMLGWDSGGISTKYMDAGNALAFAGTMAGNTLHRIGRLDLFHPDLSVGWLLVPVAAIGMTLWLRERPRTAWPVAAPVWGCLCAGLVFTALVALSRSEIAPLQAVHGRYSHVLFALALPALGMAAAGLSGLRSGVGWLVGAILLAGLPGNIRAFSWHNQMERLELGRPALVLALPFIKQGRAAPDDARPLPTLGFGLTMGWLREQAERGAVPRPPRIPVRLRREAAFRLAIVQREGRVDGECRPLGEAVRLAVIRGDRIGIAGSQVRVIGYHGDQPTVSVAYFPQYGGVLHIDADSMDIEIVPVKLSHFVVPALCLRAGLWRAVDA